MENSQQKRDQKVQDDHYSYLTPKEKPDDPHPDPIRNPDPNELPGVPHENPSQFPVRHPNEVPSREPNEIPPQPNLQKK